MLFNSINNDLSNANMNYSKKSFNGPSYNMPHQNYSSQLNYQSPEQYYKFSSPMVSKNYYPQSIQTQNIQQYTGKVNQRRQASSQFQQIKSPLSQNLHESSVKSYVSQQQYNRNYNNQIIGSNYYQENDRFKKLNKNSSRQKRHIKQYAQPQISKNSTKYLPTQQLITHNTYEHTINPQPHHYFDMHHIQSSSNKLRQMNQKLSSTTKEILKKGLLHNNNSKHPSQSKKSSRISYHTTKPTQYIFYQSPSKSRYYMNGQAASVKSKSSHSSSQQNNRHKNRSIEKKYYLNEQHQYVPSSSYANNYNQNHHGNYQIPNRPQKDIHPTNIVMNSPLQHQQPMIRVNDPKTYQHNIQSPIRSNSHSKSKKDITFNYISSYINTQSSIAPSINVQSANTGRNRPNEFLMMQNQRIRNSYNRYINEITQPNGKAIDKNQMRQLDFINSPASLSSYRNQSSSFKNQPYKQFKSTDLLLLQKDSDRVGSSQKSMNGAYQTLNNNFHTFNNQNTFRNTQRSGNKNDLNINSQNLDYNNANIFKKSSSSVNLLPMNVNSKSQAINVMQYQKNRNDEDIFFDYNQDQQNYHFQQSNRNPASSNRNHYQNNSKEVFHQMNNAVYQEVKNKASPDFISSTIQNNQNITNYQNPTLAAYNIGKQAYQINKKQEQAFRTSYPNSNVVLSPLNLTQLKQNKQKQKPIPIFKKYMSQMKDKQSQLIAGILIGLAVIILIMQLVA